jgi:hypothetical protein
MTKYNSASYYILIYLRHSCDEFAGFYYLVSTIDEAGR